MLIWWSWEHKNIKIIENKKTFQSDRLDKSRESSLVGPDSHWADKKIFDWKDGVHSIRRAAQLNSKENEHPLIWGLQHDHH